MLSRAVLVLLCAGLCQAGFGAWAADDKAPASPPASAGGAKHAGHAARPALAMGAAFAPDGRLWVVGLDAQQRLYVQHTLGTDLNQWAEAQVQQQVSDAIAADGESRPQIAFGPRGQVVISYAQLLPTPYTGMIRLLRSTDQGQTFSAPVTVHQDRQEITHRFGSIAFDGQGDLHTVWIDKREHLPKPGAAASHAGASIYHNVSHDGGQSFGPDLKLAGPSCECCRIALAPDAQGRMHALWRHVFGQQTRDHAFAALGTGAAPRITRASYDEWNINACPHHGPGLATAAGGGYHALWYGVRQLEGKAQAGVRYARLNADGAPLPGSEKTLPDARAEHADLLAQGERLAVVWRSSQGNTTTLHAWLSRDGGQSFQTQQLAQTSGYNDHPRLAQAGARMVVVWRTQQALQTHELVF